MDNVLLKSNGKTICWRKLTKDDLDEIKKLTTAYSVSEPLSIMLSQSEEIQETVFDLIELAIDHNCSVGAYDADDGEHLCSMLIADLFDEATEAEIKRRVEHNAPAIILRLVLQLIEGMEKIITDPKYIMDYFEFTSPSYGKMGIMVELKNKLEEVAREHELRYIAGIFTSQFSKRASDKCGYKLYKEIQYIDYVDPLTKKQPFKNASFHVSAKSMYLDLEEPKI